MISLALSIVGCFLATMVLAAEKQAFVDGASTLSGPYVVTDYTPTSKAKIEAEVAWTGSSTAGALFGASGSAANVNSFVLWGTAGGGLKFFYSDWGGTEASKALRQKRKVLCTPEGMWVDDVKVDSKTTKDFTCGCPLTIFAVNSTGGNKASGMLFSLKAWEPDAKGDYQLVLDLLPCVCTDGLIQFYDKKSDKVFVNKNTNFPIAPMIVVPSSNGVGDASALVSAFACANQAGANKAAAYYLGAEIRISPGVYNLGSSAVDATSHLSLNACAGARIVGLGASRDETVIVGGGQTAGRRILYLAGGSPSSHVVVSNLTLTGGYIAAANGGAIGGKSGADTFDCYDLVVSNNVALNGGGQYLGTARNCFFADNSALKGGGGTYQATVSESIFVGNGCGLVNQWSGGGAVLEGSASKCVFTGNVDNETDGEMWTFGSTARDATLTDCVISNSVGLHSIVCACTLKRCRFVGCSKSHSSVKFAFGVLDNYNKDTIVHDVVNCVFDGITTLNSADRTLMYGNVVNCTVRGFSGVAGSAPLDATSTAVNTIIAGSQPADVDVTLNPSLRYCLWSTQSGSFAEMPEGCLRGGIRFSGVDCGIRASSKAFNSALEDATVLSLVGEFDCDGCPRIAYGQLDRGAMECQDDNLPGLSVIIR